MIQIANLNPIRLRDQHDFMYQNDCHFQKWQSGDMINIQFMADEVFTVDIFSFEFGYKVLSVPIYQQQTNLIDVDFNVYEISFSVNDLPDFGKYFFRIKNSDGILFDSHPFVYGPYFENTILLRYYNSENDFNIIFETGIEFYLRVEGAVHNYSPKIDGDIYFDQKYDPTMLTSESYKTFIFQAEVNLKKQEVTFIGLWGTENDDNILDILTKAMYNELESYVLEDYTEKCNEQSIY